MIIFLLPSFSLTISVAALYVRRYFNEESKKAAIDLVDSIRDEFIKILREVSWMDNETRAAAIEKAKSMTSHIAYPDELTDNNKLEEYYDGLELESNTLLQNVLRIRMFKDKHLLKNLRTPVIFFFKFPQLSNVIFFIIYFDLFTYCLNRSIKPIG